MQHQHQIVAPIRKHDASVDPILVQIHELIDSLGMRSMEMRYWDWPAST